MDDRASKPKETRPLHLVVGASGALGSRVTRRLLAEGGRVRAASRDPARLASLAEFGAEPARLDLLEQDRFEAALDGVDRVLRDPQAEGAVRELRGVDRMSRRDALALLGRAVGKTARRQHLPVPVVRLVRAASGALHPGVHALLDLALDEIACGGDPADGAERADAVGTTRVADVVAA